MKKIYFVRHGESEWNVENKICGITDIPLTQRGHEQAVETGKLFIKKGINADQILHSPLIRAAETARHIAEITKIPLKEEKRLIEQNFGIWEGTPRNGKDFALARAQFVQNFGNGESMLRLAQRIYNLMDDLKKDDKTYILVAHNGISRIVNSYFYEMTNEEYSGFGIGNAEIKEYEF